MISVFMEIRDPENAGDLPEFLAESEMGHETQWKEYERCLRPDLAS